MVYPVYHGRGQNINRDFKVNKLPRLILVKQDGTIYKDILFMKEKPLRLELNKLLEEAELAESKESPATK